MSGGPMIALSQPSGGGMAGAEAEETPIPLEEIARGTGTGVQGSAVKIKDSGKVEFPAVTPTAPHLVGTRGGFAEDAGTGLAIVALSNNYIRFWINGTAYWHFNGITKSFESAIYGNSFALQSLDATATNPGITPRGDLASGIGTAGAGTITLIANNVEAARVTTAGLQALRPVEATIAGSGAPNLLAAFESRKILTNTGATAEAYNTLPPSAPLGTEFIASCEDTDGIRLTAPAGEVIALGPGVVSAAGGFIRSVVVDSVVHLVKTTATKWQAVAPPVGTWTIDA
jgi:hypothetical protein